MCTEGIITELKHIQWVWQRVWLVRSRHGPRSRNIIPYSLTKRSEWPCYASHVILLRKELAQTQLVNYINERCWRLDSTQLRRTVLLRKEKADCFKYCKVFMDDMYFHCHMDIVKKWPCIEKEVGCPIVEQESTAGGNTTIRKVKPIRLCLKLQIV